MNSLFSLALVSLSLVGCGTQVIIDHKPDISGKRSYTVDSALESATATYFQTCDEMGIQCSVYHLSVKVSDPGPNRAGVCTVEWDAQGRLQQRIIIRPEYKSNTQVIWHELDHCTRFQEHTIGDTPHIMRTYALSEKEWLQKTAEEWLNELFSRDVRFPGYENK